MGQRRFLYGLERTPDDRLGWSPGEAEKSPLAVAGSLNGFLTFLAHMLTHREMPGREGGPQPPPATRAAAQGALEHSFSAVRQGRGPGVCRGPVNHLSKSSTDSAIEGVS